jgi:hypothetical protein
MEAETAHWLMPIVLVLLILGQAWGMFLAYRVFQYLMKQNAELQLQNLTLSHNDSAANYAGFHATADANRAQAALVEKIRGQMNGSPLEERLAS